MENSRQNISLGAGLCSGQLIQKRANGSITAVAVLAFVRIGLNHSRRSYVIWAHDLLELLLNALTTNKAIFVPFAALLMGIADGPQ